MDFEKIAKKAAIEQVVKTLAAKKKKSCDSKYLPRDTYKSAVDGLKELGIDIKVAALYKRVQRASVSPASNSNNTKSVGRGAKSPSKSASATSSISTTTSHAATPTAGKPKKSAAPNAVRKTHAVPKEDRERYKECMNE